MYYTYNPDNVTVTIYTRSRNRKTGPGIQTWIILADTHPVEGRRTGLDSAHQCKGCPFAGNKGCYVTALPLLAIWRAWRDGKYKPAKHSTLREFGAGQYVRLGAYGNPNHTGWLYTHSLLERSLGHTGYTHEWRTCDQNWRHILMASVENIDDAKQAWGKGWNTYRAAPASEQTRLSPHREIQCPADRGIQCKDCLICGSRKKANVWIPVHGFQTTSAAKQVR